MTPSTPSILPVRVGNELATDGVSAAFPSGSARAGRSFEDYCSGSTDAGRRQAEARAEGKPPGCQKPDGQKAPEGTTLALEHIAPPQEASTQQSAEMSSAGTIAASALKATAGAMIESAADAKATVPATSTGAEKATVPLSGQTPANGSPTTTTAPVEPAPEKPGKPEAKSAAAKVVTKLATEPTAGDKSGQTTIRVAEPGMGRSGGTRRAGVAAGKDETTANRENFADRARESRLGALVENRLRDFLTSGRQVVMNGKSGDGIDTAMPADSMRSAAKAPAQNAVTRLMHQRPGGDVSADRDSFFSWKGWNHGGGEHGSSAARAFSSAAGFAHMATSAIASGQSPTSTAVSTPGLAANLPAIEVKTALGEIGATIERLVVQGREQLSVTVRFQQGGSLSLQLGMSNGEIAARIQTDVAGLDKALRSAWGEFAQDWNTRGVKLSSPVITGSAAQTAPNSHGDAQHNQAGTRDGQPREHDWNPRDEPGNEGHSNSRRRNRGNPNPAAQDTPAGKQTTVAKNGVRALKTWA